ncbi:MAG: hypothetical protein FJ146_00465 [Deltaproteobacteria bacterium]|nr:hypothetical protein [Deltaproteobacteria bacterium]
MSQFIGTMLATALFQGELREVDRIKRLSKFFDPPPQSEVTLMSHDTTNFGRKIAAERLRGMIRVSPPAGVCLTITRQPDVADERVCKTRELSFLLSDLDRYGMLRWQVSTGEGDFGTTLIWQSPYRVIIAKELGEVADSGKVKPFKFIASCASKMDQLGRRIIVKLISGESWSIYFPDKDTLLDADDDTPPAPPAPSGKGEPPPKEVKGEGHHGAEEEAPPPVSTPKAVSRYDDRQVWAIPRTGSFTMPSSGFQSAGAVTPGIVGGECRYTYSGTSEDLDVGRIECHQVAGFNSLYLPLTCLREIRPKARDGKYK